MDKLEHMFRAQKALQVKLGTFDKMKTEGDIQSFINQNAIAIYEEVSEILRCTPYKNPNYVKFGWKKNQVWNKHEYLGEIVDLFHFLMNLCICMGYDEDDFFDKYMEKNETNHKRKEENY